MANRLQESLIMTENFVNLEVGQKESDRGQNAEWLGMNVENLRIKKNPQNSISLWQKYRLRERERKTRVTTTWHGHV